MNFSLATHPVCPLLDARKNEVYAGLYDCSGTTPTALIPDCVMSIEQFLGLIADFADSPIIFTGEGALRYHETIRSQCGAQALLAPLSQHTGRAAHGAVLALEAFRNGNATDPAHLLPDYIRASEAEIARLARLNQA